MNIMVIGSMVNKLVNVRFIIKMVIFILEIFKRKRHGYGELFTIDNFRNYKGSWKKDYLTGM